MLEEINGGTDAVGSPGNSDAGFEGKKVNYVDLPYVHVAGGMWGFGRGGGWRFPFLGVDVHGIEAGRRAASWAVVEMFICGSVRGSCR